MGQPQRHDFSLQLLGDSSVHGWKRIWSVCGGGNGLEVERRGCRTDVREKGKKEGRKEGREEGGREGMSKKVKEW